MNEAEEDTPIHWVKPVMLARVKQKTLEATPSGRKRHPLIFLGFRDDIKATDVVVDEEKAEKEKERTIAKESNPQTRKKVDELQVWREMHNKEVTKTDKINLEGKEITIINGDYEYWVGISKMDVLTYYAKIAKYILPYLKDRLAGLRAVITWAGDPLLAALYS